MSRLILFTGGSPSVHEQAHTLALSLGGTNEGVAGYRPQYGNGFYSAYVRDPDGNKLAFVFYDLVE